MYRWCLRCCFCKNFFPQNSHEWLRSAPRLRELENGTTLFMNSVLGGENCALARMLCVIEDAELTPEPLKKLLNSSEWGVQEEADEVSTSARGSWKSIGDCRAEAKVPKCFSRLSLRMSEAEVVFEEAVGAREWTESSVDAEVSALRSSFLQQPYNRRHTVSHGQTQWYKRPKSNSPA